MDPVMLGRRPTLEEYRQALDYYRTNTSIEVIGERLGLDALTLEQLEHDGWPADGEQPALNALRAEVLSRLTRIRTGQLDLLASVTDAAAKTAAQRGRTSIIASQIENAIVSTWGQSVTEAMRRPGATNVADLCMPKLVLENLRALRALQDPDVDRGFVDIFVRTAARDQDGQGQSFEDAVVEDLADLTPDEQTEYALTGKKPKRQQELPFPKTEAA
jgi:hypothetical protein